MIGEVLQFHDLQELCRPGGKPRLATVEQWARDRRIKFEYDGRGGIWTTMTALNQALGIAAGASNAEAYTASDLF